MAREINKLTSVGVKALKEPGLHSDGAGLYLRIDQTLARRWVWVYFWRGKRREMGLGSATTVDLKDARKAAADARTVLAGGEDPITARKQADRAGETFGDLAKRVIADLSPGWRNPITAKQWQASLDNHAAKLQKIPTADVSTEDVLDVLKPVWQSRGDTATRIRARIERILDVAKVEGTRSGENPARWKGHLELLLAKQAQAPEHHAALPYEDLPAFLAALRGRTATAARALEFLILAATRSAEPRLATWKEDRGDVWVIPPDHTKSGKEHRVPITPRMREILDEMALLRKSPDDLIFPGDQRIEPLSVMAMSMLLRRMKRDDITVHGFRSTFRDWAGDCTLHAREVVEAALAHAVGSAVERAYRRRDALEKRRELMLAWATYCTTPPAANVLPFGKRA